MCLYSQYTSVTSSSAAGSPYTDLMSMAILKLQEEGYTQVLYNKWWENGGVCQVNERKPGMMVTTLGVDNIMGIFLILGVGLALAVFTALIEFFWNLKKKHERNKRVCI